LRELSALYRVSEDALARHRDRHLPAALAAAKEVGDAAHALDVVAQLARVNAESLAILSEARERDDAHLALKAIDRIQRQIEMQAKLLGELQDASTVNILISPEWQRVQAVIVEALRPFPDARAAVAHRLTALEATNESRG